MLFTTPDSRRRELRDYMLSFFLRILVLNFILTFVFTFELFAVENEWFKFSDNDSRGGWLSGDMIFSIPDDSKLAKKNDSIKKFVLHWGNNPHQRLGMFLPIVSFPIKNTERKIKIQFNATRVPPGATHFILFSLNEKEQEEEISSLAFIDKGVPDSKPQRIIFEQTAKKGNSVKGKIILSRAWNEMNLTHYAVYWGTGPETVLRSKPPVIVIEKRSWFGSLISQLQSPWRDTDMVEEIDVIMPNEATHLIAFSRNFEGQMNEGAWFELEGVNLKNKKKNKLVLEKKYAYSGMIAGKVTLFLKERDEESHDYLFFWGKDQKTRLSDLPPLTKFEIKKIRDGLTEKEILVSSLTMMDQKLQVSSMKEGSRQLTYKFPKNTIIPKDAKYILAFRQQKFWFQDDVERKLKGPISSVSLEDPEGIKTKIKIKKKIKSELKDFSISKFRKKDLKNTDNKLDSKSIFDEDSDQVITKLTANDWRISEYRGLGLGLSLSGLNGIFAFYDYNFDAKRQFHFNLDLTGPQVGSIFKALRLTNESTDMESVGKSMSGNYLEINRTLFSAVYRWFVNEDLVWGITEGFFYGIGGGFGYSSLRYKGRDSTAVATISGENESFKSTSTAYKHSTEGIGIFAVLDAGWQGLRDYYFQIALQPSIYIFYRDGFDEKSIPVNPGQRSTVTDRWSRAKNPSRLLLGFGIFF